MTIPNPSSERPIRRRRAAAGPLAAFLASAALVVGLGGLWNASHAHPPAMVEGGGYLSVPVADTYLTSPYGMRLHPILDVWKLHDGVDLHAPCGTPIHAAAPGTVVSEGREGSYGNQLRLDHGRVHGVELATSYNHLSSYVAQVGQQVDRGQLIAYAGSTGLATACHLHFMVYVNGVAVDPTRWL